MNLQSKLLFVLFHFDHPSVYISAGQKKTLLSLDDDLRGEDLPRRTKVSSKSSRGKIIDMAKLESTPLIHIPDPGAAGTPAFVVKLCVKPLRGGREEG